MNVAGTVHNTGSFVTIDMIDNHLACLERYKDGYRMGSRVILNDIEM